jgi:hypothetical protein
MVATDGRRLGPTIVVGGTEFRDGKISAWREYFDTSGLANLRESQSITRSAGASRSPSRANRR